MKTLPIFCSACDRDVNIVRGDDRDDDVGCAEHGSTCTGATCPICARCLRDDERQLVRRGTASVQA
jgi:hypothetical protein